MCNLNIDRLDFKITVSHSNPIDKSSEKINLKVGETKTVSFTLKTNQLAFWNADMVKRTEPGEFQVWISTDSQSGKSTIFNVKGE